MNKVFILLGTNLGNRKENLRTALMNITENCGTIILRSNIYETDPWGFETEHFFLNQVVQIETSFNPNELLDKLLIIESQMGRERLTKGYSSRKIDLDILYFNSEIIQSEKLTIPHPRMHERNFTMTPMAEIAPNFVHPVLKISQQQILNKIVDKKSVRTFADTND